MSVLPTITTARLEVLRATLHSQAKAIAKEKRDPAHSQVSLPLPELKAILSELAGARELREVFLNDVVSVADFRRLGLALGHVDAVRFGEKRPIGGLWEPEKDDGDDEKALFAAYAEAFDAHVPQPAEAEQTPAPETDGES